jgi:hypothetical protein
MCCCGKSIGRWKRKFREKISTPVFKVGYMQEDWAVKRSERDGNHCLRLLQTITAFVLLVGTDWLFCFVRRFNWLQKGLNVVGRDTVSTGKYSPTFRQRVMPPSLEPSTQFTLIWGPELWSFSTTSVYIFTRKYGVAFVNTIFRTWKDKCSVSHSDRT